MKILVVDDDEVARRALAAALAAPDRPVLHAADGEEAWELLQGGARPAICCCDVEMPRLDGIGLLRRAAGHPVWKHLPFVLVSVAADASTLQAATDAGAAGYILKPFLGQQTRSTLDAVLAQQQANRAEHFLVTRRRLDVDLVELEAMHRELLQSCRTSSGPAFARLPDRARELGLWHCEALLREAAALTGEHATAVRDELACLLEERMADIVELRPAPQ